MLPLLILARYVSSFPGLNDDSPGAFLSFGEYLPLGPNNLFKSSPPGSNFASAIKDNICLNFFINSIYKDGGLISESPLGPS